MWKPTDIYPTNYVFLYVAIISGGFDLRSGRNLGKERNGATQLLQYTPPTENNGIAHLYAYDPKHTSHKTSDEDVFLNMDYWMHMGIKLDYLFFQSSQLLQDSEIQLLKNQCEQERTQILTIWSHLSKTHASQDICSLETGQCFWKLKAA